MTAATHPRSIEHERLVVFANRGNGNMNDLDNAPPRLSDLQGDDLRLALRQRHEDQRRNWLETRQQLPLRVRIAELLFSGRFLGKREVGS